jgi:hypothetical protein
MTEYMWFPIIEGEGDDGEPHTFSNESSYYTGRRKGRSWGTTYIQ